MSRIKTCILATALFLGASATFGLPEGFKHKILIDGLDLVSAEVLPDGRVLAVEKYGKIHLINQRTGAVSVALDWEARTRSNYEAGMTQVLADPDFPDNGYLYIQYCNKQEGTDGKDWVSRFTMKGDAIDPASERKILDLGDAGPNYHHGSGLAVSPKDGMLYIASGSRFGGGSNQKGAEAAADIGMVQGKIHRVRIPSGEIPADNPFYARNTGDARAVYYYGLRNPFTMAFHPVTGVLYFNDVQTASAEDEVNEGKAPGTGYGYGGGGSQGPVFTANSAGGGNGAIVGALWYTGGNFPAAYRDKFFCGQVRGWNGNLKYFAAGARSGTSFGPFSVKPGEAPTQYNPIDVKMDAAGALYVSTRYQTENVRWNKGRVVKVWYGEKEPALPAPTSAQRARALAARTMRWAAGTAGGLSVETLEDGLQTLELRTLEGRLVETRTLGGKGLAHLAAGAKGLHILAWKSGERRAAVKVML